MPSASPPQIALTSLKIRDFRGIEHLDLDFRGPDGLPNNLVVLAGPNGCGKTAVLEAALIAAGGENSVVGSTGRRAIRKGDSGYLIQGEFKVNLHNLLTTATHDQPPSPSIPAAWYFSSRRTPEFVGSLNVPVGTWLVSPSKTPQDRLEWVKQRLTNAAAAQNFAASKRPQSHQYNAWIASIEEAWKQFYPDHEDSFFVDLVETEESGQGAFDVFFRRGDSLQLPVDDLSAGQLELFVFLASLVLNGKLVGIVFIDEPELHLDPQWHAPIVRALMELQPNAQFIVATHSPEIYDAAMSYERHFLVPEDDPRARAWPGVGAKAEA